MLALYCSPLLKVLKDLNQQGTELKPIDVNKKAAFSGVNQ
jgi:hypothetical protein